MDLIFKGDGKVKPIVRLGLALSAFEDSLRDDQRTSYRSYREHAHALPPGVDGVQIVTAEIDRQSGRPLGTRVTKILDAAQRVAALGDVMVGGSQNLIACGVWASLRLTLVTLSAIGSYRENASKLFMEIGRSAPRHNSLAILYPRSKRLQNAVCEYFILVVEICRKLLHEAAKNTLRAWVSAVFADHALKEMKHDLEQWAQTIDREVAFLMTETVEQEAKTNSLSRVLTSAATEAKERRRTAENRLRWLRACSEYQHAAAWIRTRKEGNAAWFLKDSSYCRFKGRASSCTLVCAGKLGSGKSVLLANVVDDIALENGQRQYIVTYFFVQANDVRSLTARAILGSLARQALEAVQEHEWAASLPDQRTDQLDMEDLVNLLRHVLRPGQRVFMIIDGLDHCEAGEKASLIGYIGELQSLFCLHLCVSIRLEANTGRWKDFDRLDPDLMLEIPEDNPDIARFVMSELESLVESGDLTVGDPNMIQEIQTCLIKGSRGMFLWVSLQLQTICLEQTDRGIRQALEDIPESLAGLYDSVLRRCRQHGQQYQMRILKLLVAAFRPLTATDLRQCLGVIPGEVLWSPDAMINEIFSTLSCCGSLVVVDEDDFTLHLVHPSVRQFLLGAMADSPASQELQFSLEDAHREMSAVTVTYIHIFEARGTVALREDTSPKASLLPNPQAVIKSTKAAAPAGVSKTVIKVVSKLSRIRQAKGDTAIIDVSKVADGSTLNRRPPGIEDEFTFMPYAREFWLLHSAWLSSKDGKSYRLWENLTGVTGYGNCFDWPNLGQRLVLINPGLRFNHLPIIPAKAPEMMLWAIITSHHVLLDARLKRHPTRLRALQNCCRVIARMDPLPIVDRKMATRLLTVTLVTGFVDDNFVRWLMFCRPDPRYGNYGCIYSALLMFRPGVARLLLQDIPDRDLLSNVAWPLLAKAVELGDPQLVRLLISRGAAVNQAKMGLSPVVVALRCLNQTMGKTGNNKKASVLHLDALRRLMVLYLLLRNGADVSGLPPASKPLLEATANIFMTLTNHRQFDIHLSFGLSPPNRMPLLLQHMGKKLDRRNVLVFLAVWVGSGLLSSTINSLSVAGIWVTAYSTWKIGALRLRRPHESPTSLLPPSSPPGLGDVLDVIPLLRPSMSPGLLAQLIIPGVIIAVLSAVAIVPAPVARYATRVGTQVRPLSVPGTLASMHHSGIGNALVKWNSTMERFISARLPLNQLIDFLHDNDIDWKYIETEWNNSWSVEWHWTERTAIQLYEMGNSTEDRVFDKVQGMDAVLPEEAGVGDRYQTASYSAGPYRGDIFPDTLLFLLHQTNPGIAYNEIAGGTGPIEPAWYTTASCDLERMELRTPDKLDEYADEHIANPWAWDFGTTMAAFGSYYEAPLTEQSFRGEPVYHPSGEDLFRFYSIKPTW
ncbi:hypothetical protein OQA88_11739 [Cercophora sp. LCS_1]